MFESSDGSAITEAIKLIAPTAEIGCYLGNENNRGRFAVMAFVDGHAVLVAKLATEPSGERTLANEVAMLERLSTSPALRDAVPELHPSPKFHLGAVVLTSALEGEPCPVDLVPSLVDWLERCTTGSASMDAGEGLIRRAAGAVGDDEQLADFVLPAVETLRAMPRVPAIVHGDFVPWNIFMDSGRPQVFDWEYGIVDGLAFWDEAFFVTQSGLISAGLSIDAVAAELRRRINGDPTASAVVRAATVRLMLADLAARCRDRDDPAGRNNCIELLQRLEAH